MIRIIYHWQVEDEYFDAFCKTWKEATQQIHQEVKGARGSFMLRDTVNKTVLTIARWDSKEEWESFFSCKTPAQMQIMHTLAKRIKIEVFEEIDDFTV